MNDKITFYVMNKGYGKTYHEIDMRLKKMIKENTKLKKEVNNYENRILKALDRIKMVLEDNPSVDTSIALAFIVKALKDGDKE